MPLRFGIWWIVKCCANDGNCDCAISTNATNIFQHVQFQKCKREMRLNGITIKQIRFWNGKSSSSSSNNKRRNNKRTVVISKPFETFHDNFCRHWNSMYWIRIQWNFKWVCWVNTDENRSLGIWFFFLLKSASFIRI